MSYAGIERTTASERKLLSEIHALKAERDALAARLADVEALADELRGMPPHEGLEAVSTAWVVGRLRAVLGSDAHTEQKGAGR